jgi:phosphatidyl-myo-inositol dimannoside synthase
VPVNNRNIHHSSNRELLKYTAQALPLAHRLHRQNHYDLCFAWSAVPAGGVAWAMKHLTGLRYLVRVSGPDIPGHQERYKWLYPFLTPFIRSVWHGAEITIAKCQSEVERILSVDSRAKTRIIPNGVDIDLFRPGISKPNHGSLRLLCVGRLIEHKGQRHLIKVVKRLIDEGIDLTLDLVGTGDSLDQYTSLTEKLELTDRVRFLGYIPRERISEQYTKADVFVLPSYNEGMSLALLEAMSAGLPILVTKDIGGSELIIDGENGYTFTLGDINDLANHIRMLVNDRNLTLRMGYASRIRALDYSWENSITNYLDLIMNTIETKDLI